MVRLQDMGAKPYMIAASLRAVVAQRLVRKLCQHCCQDGDLSIEEQSLLARLSAESAQYLYKKPVGCHQCNDSGYSGRVGVYELFVLNWGCLDAIRSEDYQALMTHYHESIDISLIGSALRLAKQGITSITEVLRLTTTLDTDVAKS